MLTNIKFIGNECPRAFKPGTNDKALFNLILDDVFEEVIEEYNSRERHNNSTMIGINIMIQYYYPKYGEWMKRNEINSRGLK